MESTSIIEPMGPTMRGDPLFEVARGIENHGNFDQAVLYYLERKLQRRQQLGFHNQIISSLVASHVMAFILMLHHEHRANPAASDATLTQLKALCEGRKLCGSRALRTVLTIGLMAGFLRRVRSDTDMRVYVFEPTERLSSEAKNVTSRSIGCLDRLIHDRCFEKQPYLDEEFVPRLLRTSMRAYVDTGVLVTEYYPAMHDLLMQKGATSAVAAIVLAHLRGEKLASTHQIAKQFAFSASQVRKIIGCADRHRLVSLSPQGQLLDVAPLAALYKRYFAREIALYAKYSLGLEQHFTGSNSDARVG
jgi:hypothetical protein